MRIDVLGPIRLRTSTGALVEVPERKVRLLLAALVARRGEAVSADTLIDQVWGDDLPANPARVLRAKLSQLRSVLDQAAPGGRERLPHTPGGYVLDVGAAAVDAERFREQVERARDAGAPGERADLLAEALSLWRGGAYADASDEIWLEPVITSLEELRLTAIEERAEALLEDGRPELAVEQASEAVAAYPGRERLVRALMLALYQVGRQHDALRAYHSLYRYLADELGSDPSPPVRELHGRILEQDPTLAPDTTATGRRAARARTNVPAEVSPLIGRQDEIEAITDLLGAGRLVTLTGIGGVGKTRLALQVAREAIAEFERGTWFVDLTELSTTPRRGIGSGARVAALVAAALDLPERGRDPGDLAQLCDALGSRSVLVVLDNGEHVVVEVAAFVAELLGCAAGVRVLTTSREPLGLPEEQRYDVHPLSTASDADDTGLSEAARFFAVRARGVDPGFVLDEHTAGVVTELCRRLDGLPLALELAAARIRGLSAENLLVHLSDRLNLLRRPGGGVPRRQQTLRGMIDWSWSLLDPAERVVLRRLAVHPGSQGLAAIQAVCADPSNPGNGECVETGQVVDVVARLVDRSLVTTTSTRTGVRYGLLESIATYAAERLAEAGERDAVARRHLDHYLDVARQADARLRGPEQRRWLARLEAERTQLRNAFDEAVRTDDGRRAVGLAVATFWYQWITGRHGHLHEDLDLAVGLPGPHDDGYAAAATLAVSMSIETRPGHEVSRVAEALALFGDDAVARARVQWFAGTSLLAVGLREEGERQVDDAVAVLAANGEEWDVAVAASQRDWYVVSNWGDAPRGLPDGRDPEAVLRAVGDGYGLSQALAVQQRAAEAEGDHVRAADAAERALAVCLDLGLWAEASWWYTVAAMSALRSGDQVAAAAHAAEARSLASDVAYDHGLAFAGFAESMIARQHGDPARARELLNGWLTRGGLAAAREPVTLFEDAFLAVDEDRPDHAAEAFRALHATLRRVAQPPATARMLELAAAIHAVRSAPDEAAELLGTADVIRTRAGAEPSAVELHDIERVRALVAERRASAEVAEAFARGQARDPDEQLAAVAAAFSAPGSIPCGLPTREERDG